MVYVLLGPGFEEAEALVPADLLRRAEIPVKLAGVEGETVPGSHGITVRADCLLSGVSPEDMELLFLPGGLGGVRSIQGSPAALELIQTAARRGVRLAAICAAPTVLASLGLLEGKKAVCYPGMEDQMTGALVQRGCPVVEDGAFITGEAAGSAFPFGLKLVEVLRGPEAARQVSNGIHYHG